MLKGSNVETEEELEKMMENSNENTAQAKRRKRQEDGKRQDKEEELAVTRKNHTKLLQRHGELEAAKTVRFSVMFLFSSRVANIVISNWMRA